ncbi:hypothetical protein GCM10017673_15820 [Streptosporangium violaceochromogenes]|nr:hypothetical protein GCM10017673_15820 [Streptosporangium violaceochromogenes]
MFMEIDVVVDALPHLERLRAELAGRRWTAEVRDGGERPVLRVRNPAEPGMCDQVVCQGEVFRWAGGGPIGPITDIVGVADRITFVLREVTP